MSNVAVLLSGCGVFDGAEIHESVLTLLALSRAGAHYQCFAPDIAQHHVINHLTGEISAGETRNVLVEAARIARGEIRNCIGANDAGFDALIIPGGFGAAKNLCDFAFRGADCQIQPGVLTFIRSFVAAKKPVGFVCIAPAMIPHIYGPGAKLTIGTDAGTAQAIEAMGGQHIRCPVQEFVVDEQRKLVSTPAYMLAKNIGEAATGIERAVNAVLGLIGQK